MVEKIHVLFFEAKQRGYVGLEDLFLVEVEVAALDDVFGEVLECMLNGVQLVEAHPLVEIFDLLLDLFHCFHPSLVVVH